MCSRLLKKGADKSQCNECKKALAQWHHAWASLRNESDAIDFYVDDRVDYYALRAQQQLDLFDPRPPWSILD